MSERLPQPDFWRGLKSLARTAMYHLNTHELSTHGDHSFERTKHQITLPTQQDMFPEFYGTVVRPTHFDEESLGGQPSLFPEFYGEIVDQHLGPVYYDRQGFPIYQSDIEFMRTEFDII